MLNEKRSKRISVRVEKENVQVWQVSEAARADHACRELDDTLIIPISPSIAAPPPVSPVYRGSSDSSLSRSSSRDDSVRTGLLGEAGIMGGEGEAGEEEVVGEEVEGQEGEEVSASCGAPPAPSGSLLEAPEESGGPPKPEAPWRGEAPPLDSSLNSFLTSSSSLRPPSPQRSLSLVGEEGVDEGG